MKTDMTHKILVAVSKEALKRGYTTTLTYKYNDWWLKISREGKNIPFINRDTKISEIEDWMKS